MIQYLHAGLGRAWGKSDLFSRKHTGQRRIRHAVHILRRVQGILDTCLIHVFRKRPHEKDSVHSGIAVQFFDHGKDFFCG